ncbi:MAG: hypothetical protein ACOWWM_18480 [Desulfobacterales bacterium]
MKKILPFMAISSLLALPVYALVVGYSRAPVTPPSGQWYTLQGTAATTVGADCTGGAGGYLYGQLVYDAPATGTIKRVELYAGTVSGTPAYVARLGTDETLTSYDDEATGEITATGTFEITFSTGKSVTLGDPFSIGIKGTDADSFRLSRNSTNWTGGQLRFNSDDQYWTMAGIYDSGDLYIRVYLE